MTAEEFLKEKDLITNDYFVDKRVEDIAEAMDEYAALKNKQLEDTLKNAMDLIKILQRAGK